MITVENASQIIRHFLPNQNVQAITDNLYSDRNYPPFNRVMMDGIAIRFESYQSGIREFRIEDVAQAGTPAKKLTSPNGCIEVMTGAPLPMDTNLVIQYEHLKMENGKAFITQEQPRTLFESVHLEGTDCRKGEIVLASGETLNGPNSGIAASMGYSIIPMKKPRVMIISTGDELVEVNQVPEDYQIRRSNAYAMKESMLQFGYENIQLDHLNDDQEVVAGHYCKFSPEFDLMIYSGGVSKGKFDYLPNVWTDMGVQKKIHEVSQRPGKPLWFGIDEKRATVVVGLPGNPVSSLVCLHRYILGGRQMFARLSTEITFKKELTYFLPVRIEFQTDGTLLAHPVEIKNSGEFTALAGSDGFIELPKSQSVFKSGESFSFYSWRKF